MYSNEIQKFLEERNYHITSEDFYGDSGIFKTSPQISRVKSYNDSEVYHSYLVETYDGYSWEIWMRKYNK